MKQHAPGPWKVSKSGRSVSACGIKISQSSRPCAASASAQEAIDRMLQANARLIAAAPDLLEELQELVETLERVDPGVYDLDDAKAAIANAQSRQD